MGQVRDGWSLQTGQIKPGRTKIRHGRVLPVDTLGRCVTPVTVQFFALAGNAPGGNRRERCCRDFQLSEFSRAG